jgi:hypothetical protein
MCVREPPPAKDILLPLVADLIDMAHRDGDE